MLPMCSVAQIDGTHHSSEEIQNGDETVERSTDDGD